VLDRAHVLEFGVAGLGPDAVGALAAQVEAGCQTSCGGQRGSGQAAQCPKSRSSTSHRDNLAYSLDGLQHLQDGTSGVCGLALAIEG